ncbi:TARBP2 subunit of RISC loading complex [Phyllostomus discolor]|uniref:TARBP2 subunit of RISC loading complex n=1 Tax=Phyllostomus discolor TaxID=89673 RepID=A0A834B0I9_9CHIR|nr:TARBP2 subunit of RISC loading complex [Phyllostomus discolor]
MSEEEQGSGTTTGCGLPSSFSPLDSSVPKDFPVFTAPAAATPVPSAVPTRSPPMEVQPPVSPQQSECNPVGALQELVVQKGWRLPEYTVTQESGPAHRKEFTMTCRVERFIEIGCGLAPGWTSEPGPRLHLGFSAKFSGREDLVPSQLLPGLLRCSGPCLLQYPQ